MRFTKKINDYALVIFTVSILTASLILLNISVDTEIISQNENANYAYQLEKDSPKLSYTPFSPISVTSDDDFTDYGFPGDGSEINPYRIEGYSISGGEFDTPIYVSGTTMNFVIQNNLLDGGEYSIYVSSVDDETAVIQNNIINMGTGAFETGIQIYGTNNVTIANNTLNNVIDYSIILDFSNHSVVKNNTCFRTMYCVALRYSSFCNITDNICTESCGIGMEFAYNTSITNNQILNTDYVMDGLYVCQCRYSSIINNTMMSAGLYIQEDTIEAYQSYKIEENTINGRLLGYFVNTNTANFILPQEYGQLVLINCSNIIIQNQNLSKTLSGISLIHCDQVEISNNLVSSNRVGITLYETNSNTIHHNILRDNLGYAIKIDSGNDSNIHHNDIIENSEYYSSQAFDDGINNIWYDVLVNEGNHWDDWSGFGDYLIDGSSGSTDPYPFSLPQLPEITMKNSLLYVLSVISISIVTVSIKRKRKH